VTASGLILPAGELDLPQTPVSGDVARASASAARKRASAGARFTSGARRNASWMGHLGHWYTASSARVWATAPRLAWNAARVGGSRAKTKARAEAAITA
jgi:hypothetical protein